MTKRRRILLIAVVILVALSTWASLRAHPREIVLIGVVDADEVVVTPPVQGRLDSLWVEEGSEVKAGQPIASLDHGELAAQANAAGASTASLRAQVEQARSALGRPRAKPKARWPPPARGWRRRKPTSPDKPPSCSA